MPIDRRPVGAPAERTFDGRAHVERGHDVVISAHPRVVGEFANARVGETVIGFVELNVGDQLVVVVEERTVADVHVVHDRRVGRVDAALERLQEVAFLERLRNVTMRRGRAHEFVAGRLGLELRRPEVGPDHPAAFPGGIRVDRDLRFKE
jgi:hypothetical protein